MAEYSKEEFEALAAFRYAIRRFLRISEKNARLVNITPQQYQLLLAVKGMNGRDWATVSELAERLQILHHAAVGLCTRAEQIGLITRSSHPDDRRQVCIRITENGEKLVNQVAHENRRELELLRDDIVKLFKVPPK